MTFIAQVLVKLGTVKVGSEDKYALVHSRIYSAITALVLCDGLGSDKRIHLRRFVRDNLVLAHTVAVADVIVAKLMNAEKAEVAEDATGEDKASLYFPILQAKSFQKFAAQSCRQYICVEDADLGDRKLESALPRS